MTEVQLLSISGIIIGTLVGALSAVLWWLWRTDRAEQNTQIVALTQALQHLVTRSEVRALEEHIRAEFRLEHREIIEDSHKSTESLRGEFRDGIKEIRTEVHHCSGQLLEQMRQLVAQGETKK